VFYKHKIIQWIVVSALVVCGAVAGTPVLEPVLEPVRCSGRTGVSESGTPVLYWSGASVQARFEGTSLSVKLDDKTGNNFYDVIIDGHDTKPVILDCVPGVQTYTVVSNLAAGVHEVFLFRRTEGSDGPTVFLGFVLDEGATLKPKPKRSERQIEFYGDSITCGMGIEAPDDATDNSNAHRNNYLAYGAVTARNLNAEYRCIARSGIGIIKSWFDLVMPDYWDRINPNDSVTQWDFTTWTPDVVVVNLFQNDSWLIGKMKPVPTEEQIVQSYMTFVAGIRAVYPRAHIVCALGSMAATQEGSPWPGYIHQAVERLGDEKMSECMFSFKGWRKHPRVRHHRDMADQLTEHIRSVLNW